MSTNQEIIKKADLVLADLARDGGLLQPEQADTFIRDMLVQPTLLNSCRVVTMSSPQRKINKIGFGTRIMQKAVSGEALAAEKRSKPTTGQITLNTEEAIAEINLPYDVIEDNIERGRINAAGGNAPYQPVQGGFKDTIMSMIAERAALDLEELGLLGDKDSNDDYLAMHDGFLKRCGAHIVDANGKIVDPTLFKNGVKTMPQQYLRNLASMRHYLSVSNEIEYRDVLRQRETALGDSMLQGTGTVFGSGVPLERCALMPGANGLLTHPLNLIMGIQRDISIEVDKDIKARMFIIVLTCRVAFQVENTDAAVKYINIG